MTNETKRLETVAIKLAEMLKDKIEECENLKAQLEDSYSNREWSIDSIPKDQWEIID
jgi:hypothetical protein